MTRDIQIGFGALAIIIIALVAWAYVAPAPSTTNTAATMPEGSQLIGTFSYSCDNSRTITATLYQGEGQPGSSTTPPLPGGSAHVVLSDGRSFDLNQTISADGVRYSDGDPSVVGGETFVFWTKGNEALILENNQPNLDYTNCATTQTS